ncbi:MAG: hypothetical protein V7K41_08130 [Nostoc sp.]
MNHKTTVFSELERFFENTAGIAELFGVPNVSEVATDVIAYLQQF